MKYLKCWKKKIKILYQAKLSFKSEGEIFSPLNKNGGNSWPAHLSRNKCVGSSSWRKNYISKKLGSTLKKGKALEKEIFKR